MTKIRLSIAGATVATLFALFAGPAAAREAPPTLQHAAYSVIEEKTLDQSSLYQEANYRRGRGYHRSSRYYRRGLRGHSRYHRRGFRRGYTLDPYYGYDLHGVKAKKLRRAKGVHRARGKTVIVKKH